MGVFELEHKQRAAGSRPDLVGAKKHQTAKKQIKWESKLYSVNMAGKLFNDIERGTVSNDQ